MAFVGGALFRHHPGRPLFIDYVVRFSGGTCCLWMGPLLHTKIDHPLVDGLEPSANSCVNGLRNTRQLGTHSPQMFLYVFVM